MHRQGADVPAGLSKAYLSALHGFCLTFLPEHQTKAGEGAMPKIIRVAAMGCQSDYWPRPFGGFAQTPRQKVFQLDTASGRPSR